MIREDRTRVQTLLGVNMVVEAGAGTGKTTLLIDRLCVSVLAQGIPVEKVVALTFTEKAAAEIKTRFIFKLQQVIQAVHTDAEDRTLQLLRRHFQVKDEDVLARAEAALLHLDRASIGTIHGFCAEILKMFPLEAGLSPQAQIDNGFKATQLFEQYWNSFLDTELGVCAPHPAQWKEVLEEISLPELKTFAQQLCVLKPVDYDYYSHVRLLLDQCEQKISRLEGLYAAHVPAKPRNIESALQWAVMSLRRTQAFLQRLPVPEESFACPSVSSTAPKGWDETDFEEARGLIGFAQKLTPQAQHIFLQALQLMQPLAAQVSRVYEQEGVLSFNDLIIKTRNLLQHNLYVRRILKERFDVLFIDEFQDTDPVQGELLLFLAEEKTGTAPRWQDVHLLPGKLFVVGDPKQSIYRFRGADITAYELFTDLILKQGGEKCFLQNNFRSEPGIISVANQVCTRAMVQQSAFQPAYVPIFTQKPARGCSVEWLFVSPDPQAEASADDFRHNQAEQIARWIKEQVGKLVLADGHKLAYRDIALLTRVGTSGRIYTDALRRHGIVFNSDSDKDFFRKQEINDLILFLRVVADPEDKIALAGVLRSPFGGLTDEELYQVVHGGTFTLAELAKLPQTAACAKTLLHYCQWAGRVCLHELIDNIAQETFLPQSCALAYDRERTFAYLRQFSILARQYEQQSAGDLISFLADVQNRLAQNPDLLALPAADESADAVSMLTVHKSKGLEFPVVILADLSRKETASSGPDGKYLFSWQYNMLGLRAGKICDLNLTFLEEEQKKHSRCEVVRILYVALTRAKEKLLLVADSRDGAEKGAAAFVAAGIYPKATPGETLQTQEGLPVSVNSVAYESPREFIYRPARDTVAAAKPMDLEAWATAWQNRQNAYKQVLATQPKRSPSDSGDDTLLSEQQNKAAQLGTLCHRALELLVSGKVPQVQDACAQAANQMGIASRQEEALAILKPFVDSPVFKELSACKLLACEIPFTCMLPDGTPQSGIMDAVFQTPQGIWVVDYKTDRVTPGGEQTLFDEKYRFQLQQYRQAAQRIFPSQPVRASAVFVRTFAVAEG